MWVGLKISSKADGDAFLALSTSTITATAQAAVALVAAAGYDGIQVDMEGLLPPSRAGLERFVGALAAAGAATKPSVVEITSTLYALKLLQPRSEPTAYNVSLLSSLGAGLFIMAYDLTWLGTKPGTGWMQAGPNAPLDALTVAVSNAVSWGAAPASLVLGLPLYGRVFTCDGDGDNGEYGEYGHGGDRDGNRDGDTRLVAHAHNQYRGGGGGGSNCRYVYRGRVSLL